MDEVIKQLVKYAPPSRDILYRGCEKACDLKSHDGSALSASEEMTLGWHLKLLNGEEM